MAPRFLLKCLQVVTQDSSAQQEHLTCTWLRMSNNGPTMRARLPCLSRWRPSFENQSHRLHPTPEATRSPDSAGSAIALDCPVHPFSLPTRIARSQSRFSSAESPNPKRLFRGWGVDSDLEDCSCFTAQRVHDSVLGSLRLEQW